jgi:hypothetical protein
MRNTLKSTIPANKRARTEKLERVQELVAFFAGESILSNISKTSIKVFPTRLLRKLPLSQFRTISTIFADFAVNIAPPGARKILTLESTFVLDGQWTDGAIPGRETSSILLTQATIAAMMTTIPTMMGMAMATRILQISEKTTWNPTATIWDIATTNNMIERETPVLETQRFLMALELATLLGSSTFKASADMSSPQMTLAEG